jgi:hypothetical protein
MYHNILVPTDGSRWPKAVAEGVKLASAADHDYKRVRHQRDTPRDQGQRKPLPIAKVFKVGGRAAYCYPAVRVADESRSLLSAHGIAPFIRRYRGAAKPGHFTACRQRRAENASRHAWT